MLHPRPVKKEKDRKPQVKPKSKESNPKLKVTKRHGSH